MKEINEKVLEGCHVMALILPFMNTGGFFLYNTIPLRSCPTFSMFTCTEKWSLIRLFSQTSVLVPICKHRREIVLLMEVRVHHYDRW